MHFDLGGRPVDDAGQGIGLNDSATVRTQAGVLPGSDPDYARLMVNDFQNGDGTFSPYASLNPDNPNNYLPGGSFYGTGGGGGGGGSVLGFAGKFFLKVLKWAVIIQLVLFVVGSAILHSGAIDWLEANTSPETERMLWEKSQWIRDWMAGR